MSYKHTPSFLLFSPTLLIMLFQHQWQGYWPAFLHYFDYLFLRQICSRNKLEEKSVMTVIYALCIRQYLLVILLVFLIYLLCFMQQALLWDRRDEPDTATDFLFSNCANVYQFLGVKTPLQIPRKRWLTHHELTKCSVIALQIMWQVTSDRVQWQVPVRYKLYWEVKVTSYSNMLKLKVTG